jgi:hypothetical protein
MIPLGQHLQGFEAEHPAAQFPHADAAGLAVGILLSTVRHSLDQCTIVLQQHGQQRLQFVPFCAPLGCEYHQNAVLLRHAPLKLAVCFFLVRVQ